MIGIKRLSVLLAVSLAGCGWFQSSSSGSGQVPVVPTGNDTKNVSAPACTCDDYPYPKACASSATQAK